MMPDWSVLFDAGSALQAVLWIVAAVLLIGVVIKLWPFVKNAVAIVDALVTLPEMKKQIDSIHHETHTNKGTSIKDAVERLEATTARLEATSTETKESVEGVHGRLDDIDRQMSALAREDEALWAELDQAQDPEQSEGDDQ